MKLNLTTAPLNNILEKIINKYGTIKEKPITNIQSVQKFVNDNIEIKQFFDSILLKYPNLNNYNNVMYLIRYEFDPDIILFCKICHKPLKIKRGLINKTLSKYCSMKCLSNDPDVKNKRTNTNLKKYGGKSVMDSPILRQKAINTNRKKYGVDFALQNKEIQDKCHIDIDYEKRTKTYIENIQQKYGPDITNISQVPEIKQKKKETLAKNFGSVEAGYQHISKKVIAVRKKLYGITSPFQFPLAKEKILNMSWQNTVLSWKEHIIPMFSREEWQGYYKRIPYMWKCVHCGLIFQQVIKKCRFFKKLFNMTYLPRCPHCFPPNPNRSALEINIYNYIESIYDGELLHNRYDIIPPKEIDIYLPELKLAFEVDGTYWHSEKFHDADYHKWKDDECAKQGIKLFHILEADWNNDQDKTKDYIKNLVNNSI